MQMQLVENLTFAPLCNGEFHPFAVISLNHLCNFSRFYQLLGYMERVVTALWFYWLLSQPVNRHSFWIVHWKNHTTRPPVTTHKLHNFMQQRHTFPLCLVMQILEGSPCPSVPLPLARAFGSSFRTVGLPFRCTTGPRHEYRGNWTNASCLSGPSSLHPIMHDTQRIIPTLI